MGAPKNIIIIGNGAAGTTAAMEARKRDKDIPIEIISRENAYGYNRPMLTKTIASGVKEDIFYIKPKEWYSENNIAVTLNTNVTSIDPKSKTIKLSDGSERNYDVLILATGAEAFVPPFPGKDLNGVFSIRHWDDTKAIHEILGDTTDAVIIGGGVLGLEAAWDVGVVVRNVTIIEKSNGLMSKQLDEDGSKALSDAANQISINVEFGAETDVIEGKDGKVTGVRLKSGKVIPAQLVIISTGIIQNTELVKDLGVEITRSIVVNDKMETGLEDVYAIGDCAECGGVNFGIWPQALDMAATAVSNIFGEEKHYKPIVPANMVGLSNIKLFAIGDNGKKADVSYDIYEDKDEEKGSLERYYFADGKLVGGTLIGNISKLAKLQAGFRNNVGKDEFIEEIK